MKTPGVHLKQRATYSSLQGAQSRVVHDRRSFITTFFGLGRRSPLSAAARAAHTSVPEACCCCAKPLILLSVNPGSETHVLARLYGSF